jgi:hypothetical protein
VNAGLVSIIRLTSWKQWPRGVLNYNLGAVTPNVTWKIIGNTGGEYVCHHKVQVTRTY